MRPEQKTKSSDHKNSKESKDLNGSIKTSLGASKMGKGGNENAKKGYQYIRPEQIESIKASLGASKMGKGGNENAKKGYQYMRPEQKMKSTDHKNSKGPEDVVGSIIGTGNIWEEYFSWDMNGPSYYNTVDRTSQWERPKELLFKPPTFEKDQVINDKDPLGLCYPLSDNDYRAHFYALPSSSSQKMWGEMSPENWNRSKYLERRREQRSYTPSVGRFPNKAHFKDLERRREQSTRVPVEGRFPKTRRSEAQNW